MTDVADARREQIALDRARDSASQVVADLNSKWEETGVSTRLSFEVLVGAEDQPVLTFTLLLDLTDDFDAADWPADQVERLSDEIRAQLIGSPVDDWDWLVTARAVATPE